MKTTAAENRVIEEVKRRQTEFNKDTIMVFLGYPSEVKTLISKGILKPYSIEVKKALNWYNLTESGKNLIETL